MNSFLSVIRRKLFLTYRETRAKFEEAKEISDNKVKGLFASLVEEKRDIRKDRGIYIHMFIYINVYIFIYI
jgi:adenine-specific DNA methylase